MVWLLKGSKPFTLLYFSMKFVPEFSKCQDIALETNTQSHFKEENKCIFASYEGIMEVGSASPYSLSFGAVFFDKYNFLCKVNSLFALIKQLKLPWKMTVRSWFIMFLLVWFINMGLGSNLDFTKMLFDLSLLLLLLKIIMQCMFISRMKRQATLLKYQ